MKDSLSHPDSATGALNRLFGREKAPSAGDILATLLICIENLSVEYGHETGTFESVTDRYSKRLTLFMAMEAFKRDDSVKWLLECVLDGEGLGDSLLPDERQECGHDLMEASQELAMRWGV